MHDAAYFCAWNDIRGGLVVDFFPGKGLSPKKVLGLPTTSDHLAIHLDAPPSGNGDIYRGELNGVEKGVPRNVILGAPEIHQR
jgi:hypothetical protein